MRIAILPADGPASPILLSHNQSHGVKDTLYLLSVLGSLDYGQRREKTFPTE